MKLWTHFVDWIRGDTYQNPENDNAKLLLAILVDAALAPTRDLTIENIDRRTAAWRDDKDYVPRQIPPGFSGSLETNLTRMPDWLDQAARSKMLERSKGEWEFTMLRLEGKYLQFRIEPYGH